MKILTRDDTEHDVEYVTLADAEKEIQGWKDNATDSCAALRRERDDALARVAAIIQFCEVEMGWEFFRAEFKIGDNPSKSMENAMKLRKFLSENRQSAAMSTRPTTPESKQEHAGCSLADATCSASRLTPDVEPTIAESEIVPEGQALRDLDAEKKEGYP